MFKISVLWLVSDAFYENSPELPEGVDAQVSDIQQYLNDSLSGRNIEFELCSPDLRVRSYEEFDRRAASADMAIVDTSMADLNLAFAIGVIANRGIPAIFIQSDGTESPNMASVAGFEVVRYQSYQSIPFELYSWVLQSVRRLLHRPRVTMTDIQKLWFPAHTKEILLVAATEDNPTPYIDAASPYYIYLDTLIDRDTLLGVSSFLSRFYPDCNIRLMAAERFSHGTGLTLERDLVVVGGPGVPDDNIEGNSVARRMFDSSYSGVSYSDDGATIRFAGREWKATTDSNGRLIQDVGVFARFPNPFNPNYSVVMVHGMYTLGVLGAFRAFSEHPLAYSNIKGALEEFGSNGAFEAVAHVNILEGEVVCPSEIVTRALTV